MKQDFSNGISSNEEPKHQNKKESVETDPRGQTLKEKITGITGLTLWVFFSTCGSHRCNVTAIIIQFERFSEIMVCVSLNAIWFHVRMEQ